MHRKTNRYLVLLAALACMGLAAGIASGAVVTQSITYQGRLTDGSGNPLVGTYSVKFSLYEASAGGTALASSTQSVTSTNGLFTTPIAFDETFFNGRALWLGITVGSDPEMIPRQEIRPVPYALGLRPGVVGASFTTSMAGTSALLPGVNVITEYSHNPGVLVATKSQYSEGVHAETEGDYSYGILSETEGDHSYGVYAITHGTDSDGVLARTMGANGDGVSVWTSGADSEGVEIYTDGAGSEGVYASTSGNDSHGIHTKTTGTFSSGVYSVTEGDASPGVMAVTEGDYSDGVTVSTSGAHSEGVYAVTHGAASEGVYARAYGTESPGIYGESTHDAGISGKGKIGGYFTTNQAGGWGAPLTAVNVSTVYDYNHGIRARTTGYASSGIMSETNGFDSFGVYARTYGAGGSYGILAQSRYSIGIYGVTERTDDKYGVYTPDRMSALAYDTNGGDVAEYMRVSGDVMPGTVLVIGEGGVLSPSSEAYDTRVAGIVSAAPGVSLGTDDNGNPGEALVAVAGRVPCRVDASYRPVEEGDLLSTSDTPGHAMKAEPVTIEGIGLYRPGTVLGKAMGSLASGTGTIDVLVTLQ